MADIENPSFETPGIAQGSALFWDSSYDTAAEDIAPFANAAGETMSREDFETGWEDNQLAQSVFGVTDIVAALFEGGTEEYDDFESSWGPMELPAAPPVFNHMAVMSYVAGNFTAAAFDVGTPEEFEDFEEEWTDNESALTFADYEDPAVTSIAAGFDVGTPEEFEDFEEEWNVNETAVADFDAATSTAALFDAGANPHENFEGTWTETFVP